MRRRARIRGIAGLSACGAFALVGAAASATAALAAGWVDQGPVSPAAQVANSPEIAVTANGTRVVAWIDTRVTPTGATETVTVRVAPPGGGLGPAQVFPGNGFVLRLATGADGTTALAWFGDGNTIHVAHMAPGATSFAEATPVLIPATEAPIDIRLAVTGNGEAVTAVSAFGQNGTDIWVHSLAPSASTLQLVPGTATRGSVDHGSFDAMGHGASVNEADIVTAGSDVYVAWQLDATPATPQMPEAVTVRIAKRLIGGPAGRFDPPVNIETIQQTNFVATQTLLAAGGSHVYVTWRRPDTQGRGVIGYTDLSRADTVHVISTDPSPDLDFAGADGAGTLIVTGAAEPAGSRDGVVYAAVVPAGAPSANAVELTPPGPVREPEALAVAADGDAVILPDRIPDSEAQIVQIEASRRAAGGGFGPVEDVSGVQEGGAGDLNNAAVAIGPGGEEFAVWLGTDPDGTPNSRIHLSERDATPPRFTAVSVPSGVAVGAAARMTASATDLLTGAASIRWDFGDGSQATGTNVTHVFGSAGARTVTVTATDAAGNAVTQTHRIVVHAVAVPAPVISRAAFNPGRFKVGRGGTASVAAKARPRRRTPTGSVLNLTLNVRATVVVDVRRGRSRIGELVRLSVAPGVRRLAFTGRIDGRSLVPGRYAATVTAVDALGRRSRPRTVSFTIVKR